MNNVSLIGNLVRDPELSYTQSQTAMCKFTLAVDKGLSREKRAEAEARNQPTADFINILTWGKLAENCGKYLAKGRKASIVGRIQTGSYEATDGTKRYTTEVVASQVQFLSMSEKPTGSGDSSFYPIDSNNDDIPF